MRILVTGGSGFIGTRLVQVLLDRGHDVAIFDKAQSQAHPDRVILGDVRDTGALTQALNGREAVIQLAAEHSDNARPLSIYHDVNVGGAQSLVEAALRAACRRIVFTSSTVVYPLNAHEPSEDVRPDPFHPYGQSKQEAEEVFARWLRSTRSATLVIVRPVVVFGEHNRGNVYNLLQQIYKHRFVMIGKGQNKKSMAYVGNLVSFLVFCLDLGEGLHLFNYADKPDLTTADLVTIAQREFKRDGVLARVRIPYSLGLAVGYLFDALSRVSGRHFPVSSFRVRKFCATTTASTDRLKSSGFRKPYTLEAALRKTIKFEFAGTRSCAGDPLEDDARSA